MRVIDWLRSHPIYVAAALLLLVVVAVLIALALPFRGVQANATAAQTDLTKAVEAYRAGDLKAGSAAVKDARKNIDAVTEVTNGAPGKVWSKVPVVGQSIGDVRSLADAVDEVIASAELGDKIFGEIAGPKATLRTEDGFDLPTIERALSQIRKISGHLTNAESKLNEVGDTAPFVGTTLSTPRDQALAQVEPANSAIEKAEPLMERIPGMMGKDGSRRYLVVMLNPAEIRYSGGIPLTFTKFTFDDGKLNRWATQDFINAPDKFAPAEWQRVWGNQFHGKGVGPMPIYNANFAPSWPVSGLELLRAWDAVGTYNPQGLIAVDVIAMGRLLDLTGPMHLGNGKKLTGAQLIQQTVGNYTTETTAGEANEERKAANRALVPTLLDRVLSFDNPSNSLTWLQQSVLGRNLMMYSRDDTTQAALDRVGMTGDLSADDQDYLGVFTQSLVGTKVAYHQQKVLSSKVKLRPNGSARVTQRIKIKNLAPAGPLIDPSNLYTSSTIEDAMSTFLPRGVKVRKATLVDSSGKRSTDKRLRSYYGRPFVTLRELIVQAQQSVEWTLTYDVPHAAVQKDGKYTYRLRFDPHATVNPALVNVKVVWPEGWTVEGVPAGWTNPQPRVAQLPRSAQPFRSSWKVTAQSK